MQAVVRIHAVGNTAQTKQKSRLTLPFRKSLEEKPNYRVPGQLTVQPHGTKDTRPNVTSEKCTMGHMHVEASVLPQNNTFLSLVNISTEKLWRAPGRSLARSLFAGDGEAVTIMREWETGSQVIAASADKLNKPSLSPACLNNVGDERSTRLVMKDRCLGRGIITSDRGAFSHRVAAWAASYRSTMCHIPRLIR